MADIKEVIKMMMADGKSEAEITSVIDRYNQNEVEPGKSTDPAVAEPIVGSENTASNGEESSTEYEFQTPDKGEFGPDAVPAWGRSVDEVKWKL